MKSIFLAAALSVVEGAPQAAPERPNIVFILADDLGWSDVASAYYETPNIDRLAARGMRLSSWGTCQNCAPTRACLMTGQYPPRTGIYTVDSLARGRAEDRKLVPPENLTELPLDRTTIARALQASGYATAMFGKWHLGETGAHHPGRRGFDEAITTMHKHFGFVTRPKTDVANDVYLADWLTDRAVDFITRSKDRPFFLYLPHFGVHAPLEAKKELAARFEKKAPAGGHRDPAYAAMIASVDESVGRIAAALDALGLARKTLLIFSSDNGGVGGYGAAARNITDNAPLRGGKGQLYEGGIRAPFIAAWPGEIPAGSTSSFPAAHVDLFPTLLEIAGAKAPAQPLDGVSLAKLLRDPAAAPARDALYWHLPGYLEGAAGRWRATPGGAIREGDWKLLEFFEDGRLELYHLKDDLGETKNLAAEKPERAKAMREKLAAWRASLNAPMPR
jgi:arylsulfatase A-like enzyme